MNSYFIIEALFVDVPEEEDPRVVIAKANN
jgi:hypothetical protein